jgi:dihydroorotate dehydrogenase electron transfer subunit
MIREFCRVEGVVEVGKGVFVIILHSRRLAASTLPGQFINIKVSDGTEPLLRRPFSVYRTEKGNVEIIFQIVGRGTYALRHKHPDEYLDVLGPLGQRFSYDDMEFETAVLIAGGLGVAPLPILTSFLKKAGKKIVTYLGARTGTQLVLKHLENVTVSTDDGSRGFHGTVVDLARLKLNSDGLSRPMIFGCGPTPMLRATSILAEELSLPCELSLEGPMGCGVGICQGCPVELADSDRKYALMCTDGPVFNAYSIRI